MSQHDYVIANASGATVRADLNSLFQALLSQNSGTSAPTTTASGMLWLDTTGGAPYTLKIRDAGNNHWLTIASIADPGSDGNLSMAAIEGSAVLSTGESGTAKFLRVDGDGSCSWQEPSGGGLVLLNSTTISSGVSAVNFDSSLITTTYNAYKIIFQGLSSSGADFDLEAKFSNDNGSGFIDYKSATQAAGLNVTADAFSHNISNHRVWVDGEGTDTLSGGGGELEVVIAPDAAVVDVYAKSWGCVLNDNAVQYYSYFTTGISTTNSSDRVNYIRIHDSTGNNIDAGKISLYGYNLS